MKFGYTIVYVEDVESSLEFYRAAFGFEKAFMSPEKDYGELETGMTTIAFASLGLGSSNFKRGFKAINSFPKPVGVELAFVTENIEADFSRAEKAGAKVYEPICEKPWGQKVGYVLDNNGLLIEICTPVNSTS